MKRVRKYAIIVTIFFMAVGFAAVSTSLSINGLIGVFSTYDFKLYFSDGYLNDVQDYSVFEDASTIVFNGTIDSTSDKFVIKYDVTNASKNYDANVTLDCVGNNEKVSVTNELGDGFVNALESKSGTLTIQPTAAYTSGNEEVQVICVINGSPSERTSIAEGDPAKPIESCKWSFYDSDYNGEISVGDQYSFCSETFNVLKIDGSNISLLAQQNLGSNYRQSYSMNPVKFANFNGWSYTFGPIDVNISSYNGPVRTYLNNYKSFLEFQTKDSTIAVDLVSLKDLGGVGCTVNSDYSAGANVTCANSTHSYWLDNLQSWWTKSVYTGDQGMIWYHTPTIGLGGLDYEQTAGVRPLVTIAKRTLTGVDDGPKYQIGETVKIDNQTFYVIECTDTTVSMLARYTLNRNYKQSTTENYVTFADSASWTGIPGPQEVDIANTPGSVQTYLNKYAEYLQTFTSYPVQTDLITVTKLNELGCEVDADYNYTGANTCANSEHLSWLKISRYWWTKSMGQDNYGSRLWVVMANGNLYDVEYRNLYGVRPVVILPVEAVDEFTGK